MADPIGVVGTAVGIVSFGLQLYSAVATYIDALDGRRDDLASTRAKLDSLRDSLTTIQSALPSSPSASTGTSTIPPIVTECKAELDQLEVLLQDLVGSNTSGNKLKERIKTLKFPFRRDSLMKLEDRLHQTNSVFQTALSVLNLNKSIDNERRFTNVETATAQVPAINTNVVQISTDVQDLRVDVGNMSTNVISAISTMNSNNNEALARLDLSVTQLTATAGQSLPQISNSIALIEKQMKSLPALEERLRTFSLPKQALGIQDAQGQATPRLALQRLLSKPSQTREIFDTMSRSFATNYFHDSSFATTYNWSPESKIPSAGGLSISPGITFRPVVDEESSPIFRILNALEYFIGGEHCNVVELSVCLSATKNTILSLYRDKKACAYETNQWGQSAVFKMIPSVISETRFGTLCAYRKSVNGALGNMIVELIRAGVPADIRDFYGRAPVMRLAFSGSAIYTKELLPTLHHAAPDPLDGTSRSWYYSNLRGLEIYRRPEDESLRVPFERVRTEFFGCGPLSAAISAQKSDEQISDLITARNVSEVNLLGQTPLHLAAGTGNTNVLRALLHFDGIYDIIPARDFARNHAIDYAVIYSGKSCCNRLAPVLCSGCSCSSALELLLCYEGCFDSFLEKYPSQEEDFADVISSASHSSRLRLFSEIRIRRDCLKQLAVAFLGHRDIQRYKLDGDDVLDYHGVEVVKYLEEMGMDVPKRLRNSFLGNDQGLSIYHVLSTAMGLDQHVAQSLFDLGFKDLDKPDEQGITPLMIIDPSSSRHDAAMFLWFVEHGIDLERIVPVNFRRNHHSATVAHLVSDNWRSYSLSWSTEQKQLVSTIVSVDTVDKCRCFCTETGCTPASILFHGLWREIDSIFTGELQENELLSNVQYFLPMVAQLSVEYDVELTSYHNVCLEALRMLTFKALGVRHTCGCRDRGDALLSDEDIEDIWEEDADLIGRLNELQAEFEASFDKSVMSFDAFLVEIWIPRMEIVCQQLDEVELSEAERRNAELVGVKWDPYEVQNGTQNDDISLRYPETLQEYLRALREIAEE